MARHDADREDLMAEVSALRERVELELPGEAEHVVAGFRDNGGCSFYFGPDPVFHFDAVGGLRRAFVAGDLYRSQSRTLARLTRTRTGSEVHLVRHDLDSAELARFLAGMREQLQRLRDTLTIGSARILQQVPADGDLRPRLVAALGDAVQGRLSAAIKTR
ncbi:MAG: hypothetical protein ACM3U2_20405 [Deltaproteobacteria bacterium]